ncbi:glycosyltransferase family 2 protein [Conexibacter woesei]|uniref:glycosyltransferase family 2 protein n=1 Tax=Conexibacter woesei TaxID=191495 RepID=UPI00040817A4|nr:glycosyltransferase [Conexibacter woesei]
MSAPVAVILPTAGRPEYLDAALASIVPQARAVGGDVLVVDDGPSDATRSAAARHGARYVAHDRSRGLNAARNTGIANTDASLLAFVDDDVVVRPGWLHALVVADAALPQDVGVLTGPILARFEDHTHRFCGREDPPITHLDLGPKDRDAPHAWGANMAIRRAAIERVGLFDEARELYGDEQEWQQRLQAGAPRGAGGGDEEEWQDRMHAQTGGRIRYVAAAALDHRRIGDDAKIINLMRAAYRRGRASRRFDIYKNAAPAAGDELRVLAGCLLHGPRFRCANGPILSAHSLGRIRSLLDERLQPPPPPAATPGVDDFLSGRSGYVAGKRGHALRAHDLLHDLAARIPGRRRRAIAQATDAAPRHRVLVVGIERTDVPNLMTEARAELAASRHDVTIDVAPATPGRGKFENLNIILARHDLSSFDWIVVTDDDVSLPRRFLDTFLACADAGRLALAQPAHRRHSHAAWDVTRRRAGSDWRVTNFVEIGPVTAFNAEAARVLLPFPSDLRMGWGLDAHWSALAQEHGWRLGVVDATPIGHTIRPAASDYPRETAAAEARRFLDGRPYVTRDAVRTLEAHRIGDR